MKEEWTNPEESGIWKKQDDSSGLSHAEFLRRKTVLSRIIIQNAHRLGWDPMKVAYAIAEGFLVPIPTILDWDEKRPSGPLEWVNCDPTIVQEGDDNRGLHCKPSRLFNAWWWMRCIPDKVRHYLWLRKQR